jgi:hypothetical protein
MAVVPKEDKDFYPSWFAICFGWASFLFFSGFTVVAILADFLEIRLFG